MPTALQKPFKDYFSARAAGYAAYRPTYPAALVDYLSSLPASRDVAVDCGCGSGQMAILLADKFKHVVGVDASESQLEKAQPHPHVRYICAPAHATSLASQSVDLVVAAQAAHWFDLAQFYPHVRSLLKPGGHLALVTYGAVRLEGGVDDVVSHFYRSVIGPYWPPERQLVEDGYRSMDFPFEEISPPHFAMHTLWSLQEMIGYVDTWSAVRAAEEKWGREPIVRFARDLAAAWGDPETRRDVRWPLSLRVGFVR